LSRFARDVLEFLGNNLCLFVLFFGNNLDPFQLLPGLLGTGGLQRVKPLPPFRAGVGGSKDRRLGDPERRQPLPDLALVATASTAATRPPRRRAGLLGTGV
jgi:hypothetical protein